MWTQGNQAAVKLQTKCHRRLKLIQEKMAWIVRSLPDKRTERLSIKPTPLKRAF